MARFARFALVLGAGGAVGGAFHAGVLAALAEGAGLDARDAALVIGTSAGALSGALLRAGLAPVDFLARARAQPLSPPGAVLVARLGKAPEPPELAGFRLGPMADLDAFWRLLARPSRARPGALAAAALPAGRTPIAPLVELLDPVFGERWPERPLWLCALRLGDGQRVVFGREPIEGATVGLAAAASCAIPGVYTPVRLAGERYVDGGAYSVTNADLVREEALDLVIVSAPLSLASAPPGLGLDLPYRGWVRVTLRRELAGLRRKGVEVLILEPDAGIREAMGPNPLDAARRARVAEVTYERVVRRLRGAVADRLRRVLGSDSR